MRIVSAEEAVRGIDSGQQLYLQCASATPSVLLDALVARVPPATTVIGCQDGHALVRQD